MSDTDAVGGGGGAGAGGGSDAGAGAGAGGSSAGGSSAGGGGGGAGAAKARGAPPPSGRGQAGKPECYLLVYNVAKKHNVGNIVRSACAFGVKEVIVVGNREVKGFGSQGTMKHMRFSRHATLADAVK